MDVWQGPGCYPECVHCPFGLICLGGRLHNGPFSRAGRAVFAHSDEPQVYLCPVCAYLNLDKKPFVRIKCPARRLKGAWKGGWMMAYRKACERSCREKGRIDLDALCTHTRVADPLYPDESLFIYLCEHCFPVRALLPRLIDARRGPGAK